jgi:hypothetical protein
MDSNAAVSALPALLVDVWTCDHNNTGRQLKERGKKVKGTGASTIFAQLADTNTFSHPPAPLRC